MANKYAIASGGNWNDDTMWSTTSGGVNDTTKPTAADDVFLDANSGNVILNATAACRSVNCTGYTGTLTHNSSVTLSIGDATAGASNIALKFVAGMTYTRGNATTSDINFISTSATQQEVDFANKTVGEVLFNASSGGSWLFTGAFTGQQLKLQKGTLNLNGQTIICTIFDVGGFETRTITMGSSDITVTGSGNAVAWSSSSGLTITANTAIIRLTNATGSIQNSTINYNGASFILTGATQSTSGTMTCADFTITGTAAKTGTFTLGGPITCTGTFTSNGNSATNRVLIQSSVIGTARTITAAAVSVTNTDFMDITGAGAGSWNLSAVTGGSGDCGGNSGITFTTPATQTWSGTSGGNWSTNVWTSRVPLAQDDVLIASAFSASQTVVADMPRLGKSITWTGSTGSPTWNLGSTANSIFGSITLISGMSLSGTSTTTVLRGRGSFTLTSAGRAYVNDIDIQAPGGTYTMQDDLTLSGKSIIITNGGFNTNNFALSVAIFLSTNTNTRSITLGTSTVTLTITTNGFTHWNTGTTTGLTFSGASSTIVVVGSTGTRTFSGGGLTFGTFTYTQTGSTGTQIMQGNNTFDTINFSDTTNARTLRFGSGSTTTILTAFNVNGTSGKLMTIDSSTGGSPATLTKVSGTISCDYLSIKDSIATGGALWYAGANSTNTSGNTGWIFSSPGPLRGVVYFNLPQIERAYFVQKVGGAEPREPLNNIKRRYMMGYVGSGVSSSTPFSQLEKLWLRKVITTAGVTIQNPDDYASLWTDVVIAIGKTPSKFVNDNKIKFYVNAP